MFPIRASRESLLRAFLSAFWVLPLGVLFTHPAAAQETKICPASPPPPPAPNLSAPAATLVPADECEPGNFNGNPIAFFDDYSWQAFIALVWPAKAGQRGVPDPNQPLEPPEPLGANVPSDVFETYKTDWETFQQNAKAPTEWNSFSFNSVPCSNVKDIQPGDMVLASFHEFGNVGEAGVGSLVNVLVAQNQTYVVYLAAYNKLEFNLIDSPEKPLYNAANLPSPPTGSDPPVVPSPIGAMTLKSSWIDMTNIARPERFHKRTAWVKNLATGVCEKKTVGLVGLHIVQKTPNRPQWIWSTFEQVDNVPEPGSPFDPNNKFNFNNNDPHSPVPTNPNQLGPKYKIGTAPASPPPPFNVVRLSQQPINPSTVKTNTAWQQALEKQGSVWQFYKLTMTQWPVFTEPSQQGAPQPCQAPTAPPSAGCDGSPENTFPGTAFGAPSAFANTTLETFDQQFVSRSCMACHNSARKTDFVWSLPMLASNAPSVAQTTPTTSQARASALRALQAILEQPRQ
jgi:hypothetical protein